MSQSFTQVLENIYGFGDDSDLYQRSNKTSHTLVGILCVMLVFLFLLLL